MLTMSKMVNVVLPVMVLQVQEILVTVHQLLVTRAMVLQALALPVLVQILMTHRELVTLAMAQKEHPLQLVRILQTLLTR